MRYHTSTHTHIGTSCKSSITFQHDSSKDDIQIFNHFFHNSSQTRTTIFHENKIKQASPFNSLDVHIPTLYPRSSQQFPDSHTEVPMICIVPPYIPKSATSANPSPLYPRMQHRTTGRATFTINTNQSSQFHKTQQNLIFH